MTADATFWNKIADEYSQKPVDLPDVFERKIEITRSRMRPDHTVLDIGCGTGSLALRLAPHASHVHGLDISSEMMRIADDKARTQAVDNVTFHTGPFDETLTQFEDASLDGLCAYSLLHLLEDRAAVLKHIHRLLKPGGFFVSSTVCLAGSWVPYTPLLTVMRWLGKAPMVKVISTRTLEDEVREAGFVEFSHPDVGASSTTAFIVAEKPL